MMKDLLRRVFLKTILRFEFNLFQALSFAREYSKKSLLLKIIVWKFIYNV